MEPRIIKSGIPPLDKVIQGFRLGDNVVWKIETLKDYSFFAKSFSDQAIKDGRKCIYIRFAPHEPVLAPRDGLKTIKIDPSPGFDFFSSEVYKTIKKQGREVFYIFDNLSALVVQWATDELLANFFQVICPYLFELDTVAYFALTRGKHAPGTVAKIRDTTQVLINIYNVRNQKYVHPLKVWDRYSSQMFLPHLVSGVTWSPIFDSGEAAKVTAIANQQPLDTSGRSIAPWDAVYKKLSQFRETSEELDQCALEISALKKEFSRMMIGGDPEFEKLTDRHLTLEDLFNIRGRLIGSGLIGGKAAGMLLARRILVGDKGKKIFSEIMEDHDSFYIGSDVFFTFLVNNNLFRLRLETATKPRLSWEEFEEIEDHFLAGEFPPEIVGQIRNMLEHFGQAPIIARSSSLLEDSYGNAFAGKYRSEFCANQGTPEERLEAFLRAVKLTYASALNPDALSYRRKRGLEKADERMAVLVQRVSGVPFKEFFFPALAGVALSRNLYAWTDRIDSQKGIIRLVFGLGTRAVNRVGGDYPRMVPVSNPQLRPEVGLEIAKYSQREVDLLDLRVNLFLTKPLAELLIDKNYPQLHMFVSAIRDGHPYDPIGSHIEDSAEKLVLTFNNLINRTAFADTMGEMVAELEKAYGCPIETEFTASVKPNGQVKVNLLQCRSMTIGGISKPVIFPENVPKKKVLFRASRFINGGEVDRIRYMIYIDPRRYAAIGTTDMKKSLGRVVGHINAALRDMDDKVLMMGPGRWGSSNIDLGVNVTYADIDNTAVLVEMAREEVGHLPEVSYGTHFFQDLVEAQVIYLPIYPDDKGTDFNEEFFDHAPNVLKEFAPDVSGFENVVQVIDVKTVTNGKHAKVVADPETRRAICFLE